MTPRQRRHHKASTHVTQTTTSILVTSSGVRSGVRGSSYSRQMIVVRLLNQQFVNRQAMQWRSEAISGPGQRPGYDLKTQVSKITRTWSQSGWYDATAAYFLYVVFVEWVLLGCPTVSLMWLGSRGLEAAVHSYATAIRSTAVLTSPVIMHSVQANNAADSWSDQVTVALRLQSYHVNSVTWRLDCQSSTSRDDKSYNYTSLIPIQAVHGSFKYLVRFYEIAAKCSTGFCTPAINKWNFFFV